MYAKKYSQHETPTRRLGSRTGQAGESFAITTTEAGEHHITVPRHDPLKLGTLAGILGDVAEHFNLERDEVIARTFEK